MLANMAVAGSWIMKLRIPIVAAVLLAWTAVAFADTVVLTDGTQLEVSTIIKRSDGYWVRLPDGSTRTIPMSQVKEVRKGSAGLPGVTPGSNPPAAGSGAATPARGSESFKAAKTRADRLDSPIVGVTLWEKWIEQNGNSPDLPAAKAELENWQKLQKDDAEKINGKWIGGEEKTKLLEKVKQLVVEGTRMLDGSQMVEGTKKLEEALKLYPNSFEASFELGYYYLAKGAVGSTGRGNIEYMDKAIRLLETAAKIAPNQAACWSNLAIAYNFRNRYEQAVQVAYKAAKIRDDKEVVQNLVASITNAPSAMQRNNTKIQAILEDAFILANKHGISRDQRGWVYIRPRAEDEEKIVSSDGDSDIDEGKPGQAWSGSGFFITEDGYLLTNHHVATGDAKSKIKKNISFRVRFDDGTEKNADLIAVDDAADIALMKVNVESPVPYLKLAEDNPNQAAKALVLGYPTTGTSKHSLQISEGTVKSINPGDEHEVWFDLNTTHGNSGGPIVDRTGRVIAILTAGRTVAGTSNNFTFVLGVGPNQIKEFFRKIGDKAPAKVNYESAGTAEFDGEKLTAQARKSTLLIIAVRHDKADIASLAASATTKPAGQPE